MGFAKTGAALSPDGRIKALLGRRRHLPRGGRGVFILKRLSEAERDGDEILAVIKGSAVNSDGRSNGMTAPNPDAVAVLRGLCGRGRRPAAGGHIEAHGTGTILGDPIEAAALGRSSARAGRGPAHAAGSAKTNFGHMESAAGAAGLAKIILGMGKDAVPPTINFAGPNPYIDFDTARLSVVTETTPWPRYSGRALAGVSGFGFGGTNAHVVVAEYQPAPVQVVDADPAAEKDVARCVAEAVERNADELATTGTSAPGAPATVLVVSGSLPSRRKATAGRIADWLEEQDDTVDLGAVARTLAARNHGRSRGAVVGHTRAELVAGLRALAAGDPAPEGSAPTPRRHRRRVGVRRLRRPAPQDGQAVPVNPVRLLPGRGGRAHRFRGRLPHGRDVPRRLGDLRRRDRAGGHLRHPGGAHRHPQGARCQAGGRDRPLHGGGRRRVRHRRAEP